MFMLGIHIIHRPHFIQINEVVQILKHPTIVLKMLTTILLPLNEYYIYDTCTCVCSILILLAVIHNIVRYIVYEWHKPSLMYSKGISEEELFQSVQLKDTCPICYLPIYENEMDFDDAAVYQTCCGKRICLACVDRLEMEISNGELNDVCPLCREPSVRSESALLEGLQKRMGLGDANAFYIYGWCLYGEGNDKSLKRTQELWERAAELGSVMAHAALISLLLSGNGTDDGSQAASLKLNRVVTSTSTNDRDVNKIRYHMKAAAIGGHKISRYFLGVMEANRHNMKRALKHWMISASGGHNKSMVAVGENYYSGDVSIEDFIRTWRAFKDAVEDKQTSEDARKKSRFRVLQELVDWIDEEDDSSANTNEGIDYDDVSLQYLVAEDGIDEPARKKQKTSY